jgi:inhibitor of KinA sporulation pathway (predicted exonuclease)
MQEIIIYDTEYTSWEGCLENGWSAEKNQYRELVQIAAVKINKETFEIIDTFESFIKPAINSKLSDFFINLTGIMQGDVKNAPPVCEALRAFLSWQDRVTACSYGRDMDVIKENIHLSSCDILFNEDLYQDIRPYFLELGVPDNYNSGKLHKYFGVSMEGKEHNAMFDVMSIVNSLKRVKSQGLRVLVID